MIDHPYFAAAAVVDNQLIHHSAVGVLWIQWVVEWKFPDGVYIVCDAVVASEARGCG